MSGVALQSIATINPTTAEVVRSFDVLSDSELAGRLELAASGFSSYRRTPMAERAHFLMEAARILEAEKDHFGRLMTLEMGKTLRSAIQEAEKCAWGCRYYAENGERMLADEVTPTSAARSFVTFQPMGAILAIMPWNFPFWQVFRAAAGPLMAGNVMLLKHAPNVPQCALAIEDIFRRAGFPLGVFQNLFVETERVERILGDPRVKAVTLTGSTRAGSAVAANAGRRIKKSVLELGGSDPFLVMPSADIEKTLKVAVQARMINNGQSCIAAKRFIVHEQVADQFLEGFVDAVRGLKVGNPMQDATDIGPIARADLLEGLERQVERSLQMGARALVGGKRVPGKGYFFEPTVLTEIPEGSPAECEELFGPVASVFRVRSIEEGLQMANDSEYGLGASLWSNDRREHELFIDQVESGAAFINGMVASDPRLPFGGVKNSGYGRELGSHGIREFVNIKTVVIYEEEGSRTETE
ncbi:MAG: NAD-dependent succinate-semialdehyde dehydrogenase [Candidatus Korobacteraceae bacterium]